ncbi:hypothetical protein HY745_13565 [Candidatus Desantisbacteria bacterium]|nr:hypothetical protein [Candidatus Desantisbacteria bacterium]
MDKKFSENSSEMFDKIVDKLIVWAEKGKEEGSYAIKVGKLRMNISSINLQMEEKFLEIGKKIYDLYTKGKMEQIEELSEIFSEIKSLEQKANRHKKLIQKLRDDHNKQATQK